MESKSDPNPPSAATTPFCSLSDKTTEKDDSSSVSGQEAGEIEVDRGKDSQPGEEKGDTINSSNTKETNKEGTNNDRQASTDGPDQTKDSSSVSGQEAGEIEVDRGKDSQPGEEKGDTINSSNTKETNKEGTNNDRQASTDGPDQTKDLNSVIAQYENPIAQETGNIEVDRGKYIQPGEKKRAVGQSGDTLKEKDHTDKKESTKQSHSSGLQQTNQAQIESKEQNLSSEPSENKPELTVVSKIKSVGQSGDTFKEKDHTDKNDLGSTKQIHSSGFQQTKQAQIDPPSAGTTPSCSLSDKTTEKDGVCQSGDTLKEKDHTDKKEKSKQISGDSQPKKTIHAEPEPEPEHTAEDIGVKPQVKQEKPKQISVDTQPKKTIHAEPEPEHTAEDIGVKPQVKEGSPQQSPFTELPQQSKPEISIGGDNKVLWFGFLSVFFAVICGLYLSVSDSTLPVPNKLNVVDVFNQEMDKLKTSFPSQRSELWKRSLIHLRRHLKTEHPTEPVSLILTSGRGAEKTLGCLAQCLAQAFSTSRNSSVLSINGKGKTTLDSDQVKLDIDSELTKAFEGEKFAAVIHRFEELPPGSTLIFYRYCDHENAAYKNVFLAFTIMLDAEVEVLSSVGLGRVEEMVQEHVTQKFVSSDKSAMFNQMDVDKLSGLWSRISHLILPVVAETRIEQQGCGDCNKSI